MDYWYTHRQKQQAFTYPLRGVSSLPRSAMVYLHLGGLTIAITILLYQPDLAKSIAVLDFDRFSCG